MSFSLYLVIKRAGRSLAATGVAGLTLPGHLFYVHDKNCHTKFRVDTGAEVSVVPPTHSERSHPQSAHPARGRWHSNRDLWSMLVHAQPQIAMHLQVDFRSCQCQARYLRCGLPASLKAHC